jgi:alpha-D-xyloside xylohydrolase
LHRIPLHVRAGSILAMGPDLEWATQKPANPIELRIYSGADGGFTLYEDENDTYAYERGVHATIPMQWDDANRKLTIGDRQGKFPGMLDRRTFRIVFVGAEHGVGIEPLAQPDKTVDYAGQAITIAR